MVVHGEWVLGKQTIASGNRRFSISIAGTKCIVISHDGIFLDLLRKRYRGYESPGPSVYEILLKLVPVEASASESIRPHYPLIKRVNTGENYIIWEADNYIAVANTYTRKVFVRMCRNVDCFDSFLRMLFILILAKEESILLNATAVVENGRRSVFLGVSGGEWRAAASAHGGMTLNDEMLIIKAHNGGFRVYETPFGKATADVGNNTKTELGVLYCVKMDHQTSLMHMDKARALADLYRQVPSFYGDSYLQGKIVSACRTLVERIAVYELHCSPGTSLQQVINGSERGEAQLQPLDNIQATM
jgi:hypothetical protein